MASLHFVNPPHNMTLRLTIKHTIGHAIHK
jgi:hypothetical protein